MSGWHFLAAFVRARRTVGAVAPTSRGLARRMAARAAVRSAGLVAELGPGTGAITAELLAAMRPDSQLWAFELYPPFVEHLRGSVRDRRFNLVAESAELIDLARQQAGLARFDAIVSAIPFSLLPRAQTRRMLRAAAEALDRDGVLVALQYHPRYLPPLLRAEFAVVEREFFPWNLPPALLLRASHPRHGG